MQHTTILTPRPAVTASGWLVRLRQAWQDLTLDADERFLRDAVDLADLEQRLRRLERGRAERFVSLCPDA